MDPLTPFLLEAFRPLDTVHGAVSFGAGCVGLALIVASSFVRLMVPLRALAVGSNIAFCVAALAAPNPVAVAAYLVLIPINTWRLLEILRVTRRLHEAAARRDLSGLWLQPYMTCRRLPAGHVLFRRGDAAGDLYLLLDGELLYEEIGKAQPQGELFGEISFFAPDGRRTLTARCTTPCTVLGIAGTTFRQLYFQRPEFAYHVTGLITQRLGADIARLRGRIDELEAAQRPGGLG